MCVRRHNAFEYNMLISAYDAPYMRRTNHTGAATRLVGTCVSANNDVLGTAIEYRILHCPGPPNVHCRD